GSYAACFHRVRRESLIVHALLYDNTAISQRLCEDLIDLISRRMHPEGHVSTKLFIQQRRAGLHGRFDVNSGWQWLVINLDQVTRIARDIAIMRDDNGNGIAKEAYLP